MIASQVSSTRAWERVGRTALSLMAALAAFESAAQATALDMLRAGAVCGALGQGASPEFLGHCLTCWASGAAAFLLMSAVQGAAPLWGPKPHSAPVAPLAHQAAQS